MRHQQRSGDEVRGWDLQDIYQHPQMLHGLIHNHMVKMLAMDLDEMNADVYSFIPFHADRLERAKEILAERIDVVGLTEDMPGFCRRLESTFGWSLGEVPRLNTTEPIEVDPEFRSRIAEDNHYDMELYRFAVDLLEERFGGSSTDVVASSAVRAGSTEPT